MRTLVRYSIPSWQNSFAFGIRAPRGSGGSGREVSSGSRPAGTHPGLPSGALNACQERWPDPSGFRSGCGRRRHDSAESPFQSLMAKTGSFFGPVANLTHAPVSERRTGSNQRHRRRIGRRAGACGSEFVRSIIDHCDRRRDTRRTSFVGSAAPRWISDIAGISAGALVPARWRLRL